MKKRTALILTVMNEEKSLGPFLQSISSQSRLPDEIVIVDGGSRDRTVEKARAWGQSSGLPVTVYVEAGANISRGRNTAIRLTKSDIIAVTDGGCILTPVWLDEIVAAIERDEADVTYGPTRPLITNTVSRAFAAIKGDRIAFGGSARAKAMRASPSSRSLAFRKSCGEKVGLYPEWLAIAEDSYFFTRMEETGCTISYAQNAVVHWNMRDTLREIAVQFYKYGWGEVQAGMFLERAVLRIFYYALLVLLTAGLLSGLPVWLSHLYWIWLLPFVVPGWLNLHKWTEGASLEKILEAAFFVPVVSLTMESLKLAGSFVGFSTKKRVNAMRPKHEKADGNRS